MADTEDPTGVELGDMQGWYAQYLFARDAVAKWEEVKKTCRDRLVEHLEQNEADQGTVDGRPVVKRSVINTSRFATARFRAAHPDLAEEFTSTTSVTRLDVIEE